MWVYHPSVCKDKHQATDFRTSVHHKNKLHLFYADLNSTVHFLSVHFIYPFSSLHLSFSSWLIRISMSVHLLHSDGITGQMCCNFPLIERALIRLGWMELFRLSSRRPLQAQRGVAESRDVTIRQTPWLHKWCHEPRLHNHVFRIKTSDERLRWKTVALTTRQRNIETQ